MRYYVLSLALLTALFATGISVAAENDYLNRGALLYDDEQYEQARAAWEEGEKAGDLDCSIALGTYIYSAGRGAAQSDQKAFTQYMRAAQKNHAEGMSIVGSCYLYGSGVAKDTAKGIEWLTKAAEAGLVTAAAELGELYADGESVKKDAHLAAKWHLQAAKGGHPQSQLYMGKAYMTGNGVDQDKQAAKQWLQKAEAGGEDTATELLQKLE